MQGAAVAALLAAAVPAVAQAQTVHSFDIPAGSLGSAVARLGSQAGVVVSVDPVLVRGKRTAGLEGRYTAAAALERLLTGAGLSAQADGQGGYRLVAAAPAATGEVEIFLSDPIVVVGALTDVEITSEELELRQASDLADIFRNVPSVTVGGSLGIAQKIYVRGLEDSLVNVTVDGAPQRGTLFHHIGRVSIEPELLKTVDVQAGAGEATAGFGAIGGAIRYQTKNAGDLLAPGQQVGALVKAGYFSNDGHKLSGSVYGRIAGDFGFLASLVHVERNDMEDGDGQRLVGTAARQQLGFLKVGGGLEGGHRLSASYEHREEKASFGQRPNWPVLNDMLFPAVGKRQTAVFNYGFDASEGLGLEATAYWTRSQFIQDRWDAWGPFAADIRSIGFDVRGRLQRGGHDIVVGAEQRSDRVRARYLADQSIWGPLAWDPDIGAFEEEGGVLGLYAQDHWRIIQPLMLSYGVRYDAYDLDQVTYVNGADSEGFSFNAGLTYEAAEGLELSASYAEAFRGKEIGDAFLLEQNPSAISLSPTLEPEKVKNYEVGAKFERGGFSASAVYYTMRIDDVIFDKISGPVYYENVGRYDSEGVELRVGYDWGAFSVDGYYNHYTAELNGDTVEGYEHVGLGNSVGDNWNLTGTWRPSSRVEVQANVIHYQALNDIEVLQRALELGWVANTEFVDKPAYTVVDIAASWRPFEDERLSLNAAVYNLFDQAYRAHSSVADYSAIPGWEDVAGVKEPGRNLRLTVGYRF